MTSFSVHPSERRRAFRFAVQHQSRLRLTLEGAAGGDDIEGVMLTDISQQGLMAAGAGHLVPGVRIMIEVPLVGWREVDVIWIAENRAGCRFVKPLDFNELRSAAASSERLALECPSLAAEIALLPAVPEWEDQPPELSAANPWLRPAGIVALAVLVALAVIIAY